MAQHDLIFFENRSTPQVVSKGAKAKPKKGYGKVTRRRAATAKEEEQIENGQWLRVRRDGKGPNDPGSKKSNYRPEQAKKQKTRSLAAKGRKLR